jgi:hypothetical protein
VTRAGRSAACVPPYELVLEKKGVAAAVTGGRRIAFHPAAGDGGSYTKKSQADKPAWPFWLKLSAGGQLDGYFE